MDLLSYKGNQQTMDLWIRDKCPTSIDGIIGNDNVREVFRSYLISGNIPNILLTGDHGTCKRTFTRLLVQSYLGADYDRACLRIDGAMHRGKDVISTSAAKKSDKTTYNGPTVQEFARTRVSIDKKKIIIIYNFEDMTIDAQNALRRIMETYSSTTRFILICNNLENIIEPIQSRCIPLTTVPLSDEEGHRLINSLTAHLSPSKLPSDIVDIIILLASGDAKKIINYTQIMAALETPTITAFHNIFNIPPIKVLERMLVDISSKDPVVQNKLLEKITFLIRQGYNYFDTLELLGKIIMKFDALSLEKRARYYEILNKEYCHLTQMVPEVHIYALFSKLFTVG